MEALLQDPAIVNSRPGIPVPQPDGTTGWGRFLKQEYLLTTRALFAGLLNSIAGFLLTIGTGEFFVLHYGNAGTKGHLLHRLGIHLSSETAFFSFMLLLIGIKAMAFYQEKMSRQVLSESWVKAWREQLFARQLRMDLGTFRQKPYGQYLLRYSNDMKAIQQFLSKGILGATTDLVYILTGLCLIAYYSAIVSLLVLVSLSGAMLLVTILVFRQQALVTKSRSERSRLLAHVTKAFSRFRKITEEGSSQQYWEGFSLRSSSLYEANLRQARKLAAVEALSPLLQYGFVLLVIAITASGFREFPAADLLIMIMLLLLMQGAFRRLFQAPAVIMKGLISILKFRNG